jgi:hypothetical protein
VAGEAIGLTVGRADEAGGAVVEVAGATTAGMEEPGAGGVNVAAGVVAVPGLVGTVVVCELQPKIKVDNARRMVTRNNTFLIFPPATTNRERYTNRHVRDNSNHYSKFQKTRKNQRQNKFDRLMTAFWSISRPYG